MRAVLDTNVLVSAFVRPRGRVAPLWWAAQARCYRLLLSPAIIREVARVLREDFLAE
ncbi:MAG TPA: PIN domain-containing protein [Candidatus Binatia bacterium]|jgi:predicted nucleic acid-binding protein|nr:PIN domain-containing protein [Candidatus Binatia bacterium]